MSGWAAADGRHRVAVLLLAPVIGFDATIPPMVLGSVTDDDGRSLYDVKLVGLDRAPVPTPAGYTIVPSAGMRALADADTVIVPGTRLNGARLDGSLPNAVRRALNTVRPGTRVVSICTGAFVLGAAGLLDGRPATTHWSYADKFRSLFPRVKLDERRLYIDDGDVITSAGLAAGIDMCLHLVRRDFGVAAANRAARYCVVAPWRDGGQAQFIDPDADRVATSVEQETATEEGTRTVQPESTAEARAWAREHLHEPVDVARLAARANMSVRTFNRRFKEEVGTSPGAWLVAQRVSHARRLLEQTELGVDDVAAASGLGSAASLRQHLRVAVGVSPARYRRTFRGA